MEPSPGDLWGFSRYAYANNNPYTNIDPDGRQGKVAWLVRLTANGMKRIARLTKEEAVQARRSGENILADRKQLARQVETAANGSEGQLKHVGHELEGGFKGLPHYQTEGEYGHSFWGKVSAVAVAMGVTLDKLAEAAEYLPDPTPRPATKDDLERSNRIIWAINGATGLNIPRYDTGAGRNSGFRGVFNVNGRIDPHKLANELDKKK